MSLSTILIGIAIFLLVIPFIANPFYQKKEKKALAKCKIDAPSADQYAVSLVKLRDLDFDHNTGKVTDEDYASLRMELLAGAASELEAKRNREQDLESLVEEAILARKKEKASTRKCGKCGKPQKIDDHFCSSCGAPLGEACPNCGGKIEPTDLYCTGCGQYLKKELERSLEVLK